jgi:hypothetical protein
LGSKAGDSIYIKHNYLPKWLNFEPAGKASVTEKQN